MTDVSVSLQDDHEPPVKLVDVDCNLWHKDLKKPLLPILSSSSSTLNDREDEDDPDPFTILVHDDLSHCAALLSPSPTLLEAQQGLQWMLQRQEKRIGTSVSWLPIKTTIGIHPYHVNDHDCLDLESIKHQMNQLLSNDEFSPFVAAVGECGLDASDGFPPLELQVPYFQAQIQLATTYNLPLFVHERLAFDTCCQLLDDAFGTTSTTTGHVPVIIHCFTGTRDECLEYVRRGYSLSISGYIFKDETIQRILQEGLIPLDKLMVETDAPYMGFAGCRDRYLDKHNPTILESLNSKQRKRLKNRMYPNVPSSLPIVFDKVVEQINVGRASRQQPILSRSELAQITTSNANRFFSLGLS